MSARVNLYLVPAVLILAAAGASWLCAKAGPPVARRGIIVTLGCLLALFAARRLVNDLGHPYRAPWDRTARDFARWFWEEMSADAEVVCVRSDLGISSAPRAGPTTGQTSTGATSESTPAATAKAVNRIGIESPNVGRFAACCFQVARAGAGVPQVDRRASRPLYAQGRAALSGDAGVSRLSRRSSMSFATLFRRRTLRSRRLSR